MMMTCDREIIAVVKSICGTGVDQQIWFSHMGECPEKNKKNLIFKKTETNVYRDRSSAEIIQCKLYVLKSNITD